MQYVNDVSDAVLEVRLPDEEMVSIQTNDITFILGRHTPAKLAGLKIESNDGKFVLPDVPVFKMANNSFVDTQVTMCTYHTYYYNVNLYSLLL